jgi:hypothetical protein
MPDALIDKSDKLVKKMNHIDKHRIFNIRYDVLICLFLVIAILVVYWQVGNHTFINLDDGSYILNNPHIRDGLNFEGIAWAFSFPGFDYWHPLTWLIYK